MHFHCPMERRIQNEFNNTCFRIFMYGIRNSLTAERLWRSCGDLRCLRRRREGVKTNSVVVVSGGRGGVEREVVGERR